VAVLLGLSLVLCIWWRTAADSGQFPAQRWQELAPIPDALGVAGPFVGASGGALLLAGGANFPDQPPWEGGAKHWLDAVYALESPQATRWMLVGRLPHPLGYGVSASWRGRLLCVGGSDGSAHRATVLALRYSYRVGTGTVEMEAGPSLPVALANAAGVLVGDVLYGAPLRDFVAGQDVALHAFALSVPRPEGGRAFATARVPDAWWTFCAERNLALAAVDDLRARFAKSPESPPGKPVPKPASSKAAAKPAFRSKPTKPTDRGARDGRGGRDAEQRSRGGPSSSRPGGERRGAPRGRR
jgi:hypothetical protein